MKNSPWLLPAGVDEILPQEARRLESLRRSLLDLYECWGYQLVVPPLIEYLESLLTGAGSDLDLQTFKLTDQLNGRLMGVRADMTPQVARIDAHHLKRSVPTRLCYMGSVLHTRPDGFAGTRSPYQVGAELYGHAGPESDAEVLCLLLETLKNSGIKDIYIDLGHVGIYRQLADAAGLSKTDEAALFDMLQRKALPEIQNYLSDLDIKSRYKDMLASLAGLNGDADILSIARRQLSGGHPGVIDAIDYLEAVAGIVNRRVPDVPLHYDLAELRGYHYQTGIVFAAFVPGQGQEIARGGRYDDIGRFFGCSRPATGFSTDLRSILKLSNWQASSLSGIFAPAAEDPALLQKIAELRAQGERVIKELPGQTGNAADFDCDRVLVLDGQSWVVKPNE